MDLGGDGCSVFEAPRVSFFKDPSKGNYKIISEQKEISSRRLKIDKRLSPPRSPWERIKNV